MKAEELFKRVLTSYQRRLSSTASTSSTSLPSLRDPCRSRQVSYTAFIRWATTHESASSLLEIERFKKRLQKKESVSGVTESPTMPSCPSDTGDKPLLYPLHIISDSYDHREPSIVLPADHAMSPSGSHAAPLVLHGIRILFPNEVKITVQEADSRGIHCLIHGKE